MTLKKIRKGAKVTIKDTGLSTNTVKRIEEGNCNVRLCSLNKYLTSIGLKISYSID